MRLNSNRMFQSLALAVAMAALSGAAWAQCTPAGIQGPVKVSLINTPFPCASLDPVPGGALPALPNPAAEEIARREHIYISTPIPTGGLA